MELGSFKIVTGLAMILLTALPCIDANAHMDAPHERDVPGPGPPPVNRVGYEPPEPGSYRLPPIQRAADGKVIDSHGIRHDLFDLMTGKTALLSFVYTKCHVPGGCPLALGVLNDVRVKILDDAALPDEVVLITLSFDPENDTPAVMRKLAEAFDPGESRSRPPWYFLTTPSRGALQPILEGYGQYVVRETDSAGRYTGGYSHVLKVFLVDPKRRVRNIYSTSFLDPDLIIGDIRTLQLEKPGARAPGSARDNLAMQRIQNPPLGLPEVPFPGDNPPTPAKIRLGRKLFFDRRLSHNGTLSCAMCHVPEQGFTVNETATAVGNEGKALRRNAPSLFNVAFMGPLFHDGRETALETQVISPLLAADEMGNPSIGYLLARIGGMGDYNGLFEAAFGRGASVGAVGEAIATYERSLLSANSRFDRWYFGKEKGALTAREEEGFRLFSGKANCAACHRIAGKQALFTDNAFHDTGLGWKKGHAGPPEEPDVAVQLAPGVFASIDRETVESVGLPEKKDLGRYEVTRDPSDLFRFKTPTLRNVGLTAPYMHDGSLGTLRDVLDFYNRGGHPHKGLDPLIRPLGLKKEEMDALEAFLNSLTGDNVRELTEDARSEPVGNPGETFFRTNTVPFRQRQMMVAPD